MKFRYSARTKTGELQVGYVEAVNREAAFNILTSHDLFILSIESAEFKPWYEPFLAFFKRIKKTDLMIFTRQFATMLTAKIAISDSLRTLYQQTKNPLLKEVIFEVSSDIDAGLSLSQALEKHGQVFSQFYVNLIRSAEVTGRVEEAMNFLADYLEKEITLVSKVRNALIYPVFILVLFFVVGGILVGLVFPQLKTVFEESNVELPYITSLLFGVGDFIRDWWLAILVILIIAIFVLVDYFRSPEGKIVLDQFGISLPGIGRLFKNLYIARFAEAARVLVRGGIPIIQSIEIAGHTIGSAIYRDVLHEVAERVRQGELLSQALFGKEFYFPILASQMIAVGEQTGKLEEMLERISIFYSREVDNLVSNLVELIQPIIMVFIGLMVGLLFASVLIPIYNLVQVF
jgi:type IV pilus assembly protein PilC